MEPNPAVKGTFEDHYPEINRIVQSRRGAWTYISLMEWADVAAKLTERIWKQWHLYDPAKASAGCRNPLEHWANSIITNALFNLRRDLLLRWSRPCIGGWNAKGKTCFHNQGGDSCEITKSHKQCDECPIYADWQKAREHQLHIKSTVALDNHAQEVSNVQGDFCDVEGIEERVHAVMKANLTTWEFQIYRRIYIQHLPPATVSAQLEALVKTWKRAPREDEQSGYQFILAKQRWFKDLMLDAFQREGYDLRAFRRVKNPRQD